MKQKPNENNDALSTGDLLGRLKQNFADTDAPAKAPEAPAPTDDELDIATLLKQYLPEEVAAPPATVEDEESAEVETEQKSHLASMLDALGLDEEEEDDPLSVLAPEPPEPVAEPAPVETAAPVASTMRKYVYRFRPSARNAQTVKVQETVPVTEPIVAEPPVEPDEYFAGRATRPEFDYDDEPVIPDAAAFDDLIPPLTEHDPVEAETEPAPEQTEAEAESESAQSTEALDDTDINLMIALGYEDELSKTVGIDRVSEIERQLETEGDTDTNDSAAFRGFEYTEKSQTKEIMQNYRAAYGSMTLRLIGTLILTVALFLYENVSLLGIELPGALNMLAYPTAHTLISLQLLVLAGALSWQQLLTGLKGALTLKPIPQSLPAVAVAVAVLYDIIIAILAPTGGLALYNFPAALCLCLMVICDMMNLKREIYSFTILADRAEKYGVRAKLSPATLPEEETLTLDIRRASFITGYFARTGRKPAANVRLNYVLLPVVALAIALGIVAFSTEKAATEALGIFVLTVLFCMPISTLIACSYPLFRASQLAYEQDTAIIGEASAEEYSGADVVSFADKDVFPSYQVKLRSIKLYGNARPDLVLFAAASVFSKVGGPLNDVLELATKEFDRAEQIELTRITESGIEAIIDGVTVLVGRSEFLEDYNLYPLRDAEDDANTAGGARILYIVMDDVLSAKLYVQYEMDADFAFTLCELGRENIAARIRTYDPNIDDALISAKLRGKSYAVTVDKLTEEPSEPELLEKLDSGLVSRASAKSLVHTAAMCSHLGHVERVGGIVRSVALGVSLLIMLFLTLLSSTTGISSLYVALYQIFWMIPALLITRLWVK